MQKDVVRQYVSKIVKGDPDLKGLIVYNVSSKEIYATTFSDKLSKLYVKIEKMFQDLEGGKAEKLDPAGGCNWAMSSLGRKIVFNVRITDTVFLFGEFLPQEAPSAVIEDALEIALTISRLLKK